MNIRFLKLYHNRISDGSPVLSTFLQPLFDLELLCFILVVRVGDANAEILWMVIEKALRSPFRRGSFLFSSTVWNYWVFLGLFFFQRLLLHLVRNKDMRATFEKFCLFQKAAKKGTIRVIMVMVTVRDCKSKYFWIFCDLQWVCLDFCSTFRKSLKISEKRSKSAWNWRRGHAHHSSEFAQVEKFFEICWSPIVAAFYCSFTSDTISVSFISIKTINSATGVGRMSKLTSVDTKQEVQSHRDFFHQSDAGMIDWTYNFCL